MKFIRFMSTSLLVGMLAFPITGLTTNSSDTGCSTTNNQTAPEIALTFIFGSDNLDNLMAQSPTSIFFKVPNNTTSTLSSSSYSDAAQLLLSTHNTTMNELTQATSAINTSSGHYIVLDTSLLAALTTGSFLVPSQAMPAAMEQTKKLTVVDAAILDTIFVVLTFNQQNEGQTSSFSNAVNWKNADHLKVFFKSQMYPE